MFTDVQERLTYLLSVQEKERHEHIKKRCLFCREEIEGPWKAYLDHLRLHHLFRMGPPENIVFIDDFVTLLETKLQSKTFKTQEVLKQHMRKKKHLRIHPKNKEFDKYYMINYLEPSKSWEELQNENDSAENEEESENENEADTWEDWQEEIEQTCKCLFCPLNFPTVLASLEHSASVHQFDLQDVIRVGGLDFYSSIKLINYIRKSVEEKRCIECHKVTEDLCGHMTEEGHSKIDLSSLIWQDDSLTGDSLLFSGPPFSSDSDSSHSNSEEELA